MTTFKKPLSDKPPGMSDELWEIFMAHKGDQGNEESSELRTDCHGGVEHVRSVSPALYDRLPRIPRGKRGVEGE